MMKAKINVTTVRRPVIVLLVLFSVAACSGPEKEIDGQSESIKVSVQNARMSESVITHRYAGVVVSSETAKLSTTVMGTITRFDVEEGDVVRKGDVLVRIKDDQLNAQHHQVESNLEGTRATLVNAEANYQRILALYERDSATKQELDEHTSRYEMAKAHVHSMESKLAEIREMLSYTALKAPFDGHIVSTFASESDMAIPGQPLVVLERKGEPEFHITIPESDIANVSIRDTVSIQLPGAEIFNESGIITTIHPVGAPGSSQFTVEALPLQSNGMDHVRSGMFVEIGLIKKGAKTVLVPRTAILERGQLTGMFTLTEESELLLRWVRLGQTKGTDVEVLSGLSEGDLFVSSVHSGLREGLPVTIH